MQHKSSSPRKETLDALSMCEVLSVTEDSATLILRTSVCGDIDIRCDDAELSCKSAACVQLVPIDGLVSDKEYTVNVTTGQWEKELHFCTFPKPDSEALLTFAVVADPHISFGKPATHGRIFDKTRQILRETVEDINAEGVDLVILPGDITEDGLEEEMREARAILDKLECEEVPVFGDHELYGNIPDKIPDPKEQCRLWCEIFDKENVWFAHRQGGAVFIALDTDNGVICREQVAWLKEILATIKHEHIFVGCHRALVPDENIDIECISNSIEVISMLRNHPCVRGVFVGHKNVPSTVQVGNIWQIVCPQICEFPCGYLIVKLYKDYWTSSFTPISSETFMEESFQGCHNDGREQWAPGFRIGIPQGRNGVYPLITT